MARFGIVRTPVPVYLSTYADAEAALAYLYDHCQDGIGVDTETTGLDTMKDRIRFFSLATAEFRCCAPVRLLPVFEGLLADPTIEKHLTNEKYDRHLLWNHGVWLEHPRLDTADMDFLLDENRQGLHGLKECAFDYLGLRMTPFSEVFGHTRSVARQVEIMCWIHDVLEMHDHDNQQERAIREAREILLELKSVDGDPIVLKAIDRLRRSLRADGGTRVAAKSLVTLATTTALIPASEGVNADVEGFLRLIAADTSLVLSREERSRSKDYLKEEDFLRMAHENLLAHLLTLTGMPDNPIEALRERAADYASLDAWSSHMLTPVLLGRLDDELMMTEAVLEGREEPRRLSSWVFANRQPLIDVLWMMERRGIAVDVEKAHGYGAALAKEIAKYDKEIVRLTGNLHFNPDSSEQVLAALYTYDATDGWLDPFGDPPKKWTGGGASGEKRPSVDKEVLEDLEGKGEELAGLILARRKFVKLKGDFVDNMPLRVDRHRRVHTTLKSTGAVTWRLSSSDPNLQNIPVRDELWGPLIRALFIAGFFGDVDWSLCLPEVREVAPPDLPADFPMVLIVADYKQLEMAIMAHFSRDEKMIEAINTKKDIHCLTVSIASEMGAAGVPAGVTYDIAKAAKDKSEEDPDNLTEFETMLVYKRSGLKSTGFGIIYGIGALKLGMQLKLKIVKVKKRRGPPRDECPEAQELIDSYLHSVWPGVGRYIEDTTEDCYNNMVVHTVVGHPRRLPDIRSYDRGLAARAKRQAGNSRIQGSAADICNEGMLKCERDPRLRAVGARLLLQVHDELIFECPDIPEYIEAAKKYIKENMENPFKMRTNITISIGHGKSWADAK